MKIEVAVEDNTAFFDWKNGSLTRFEVTPRSDYDQRAKAPQASCFFDPLKQLIFFIF
jgi:hypothetical protein